MNKCPACGLDVLKTGFSTSATVQTAWMLIDGEVQQITHSTRANEKATCLQCGATLSIPASDLMKAA